LRAISTKSLEEQRQLLGTVEALNGMLLFGLTTAFLLAKVQICGVGQRRWCFLGFNLGDAGHRFLA